MKKIAIITVIILYLFIGIGLLAAKQIDMNIIIFVAIKICGVAFIGIAFYVMYTFEELVE